MNLNSSKTLLTLGLLLFGLGCSGDPSTVKKRYLESGKEYVHKGSLADATVQFRKAIQVDPRFEAAYQQLGLAYLKLQQWREALASLEQAVDLDPGDMTAHFALGNLYLRAGDFENARKEADLILENTSDDAGAYQLLAASYIGFHQKDKALDALGRVAALRPKDPSSLVNIALLEITVGRSGSAVQHLRKAIELDPHFVPSFLDLSRYYLLQQEVGAALQVLREGLDANRDCAALYVELARVLYQQQKPSDAEQTIGTLLQRLPRSPEAAREIGDLYTARGEIDRARVQYRRGLTIVPGDVELQDRLVDNYLSSGDVASADEVNRDILRKQPGDSTARAMRGRILLTEGLVGQAIAGLKHEIEEDPDSALAHYYLGLAQWRSGNDAEAKDELQKAINLNSNLLGALNSICELSLESGDGKEALAYAKQALKLAPKSATEYVQLGRAYLLNGDTENAKQEFQIVLKMDPSSAVANFGLALVCRPNSPEKTEQYLESALKLQPSYDDAFGALLDLWLESGQQVKALTRAQAYATRFPQDAAAWMMLGWVYQTAKQYEPAEAELQHALRINPKLVSAHIKMGKLKEDQHDFDAAIASYETALSLQPSMTAMYVVLGNLYAAKGDLMSARRSYENALKENSNFALAASNLAWVYAKQGDLDSALPLAEKAWRLMPDLDSIADVLGWIQYRRGNYIAAERLLRHCLQQAPTSALYHEHLGMTLAAIGKTDAAREQLRACLRLQPNSGDANEVRTMLASLH